MEHNPPLIVIFFVVPQVDCGGLPRTAPSRANFRILFPANCSR